MQDRGDSPTRLKRDPCVLATISTVYTVTAPAPGLNATLPRHRSPCHLLTATIMCLTLKLMSAIIMTALSESSEGEYRLRVSDQAWPLSPPRLRALGDGRRRSMPTSPSFGTRAQSGRTGCAAYRSPGRGRLLLCAGVCRAAGTSPAAGPVACNLQPRHIDPLDSLCNAAVDEDVAGLRAHDGCLGDARVGACESQRHCLPCQPDLHPIQRISGRWPG